MKNTVKLTAGTGSSVVVDRCQICDATDLDPVLFLGYLPPVNLMQPLDRPPREEAGYPAQLLLCKKCQLVQIGLIVDPNILFPPTYPYTSGTTRILRENFKELSEECQQILKARANDLVVDIGSNDGTLLSNFQSKGYRVQGIEPTERGHLANERKIPTLISFFGRPAVDRVLAEQGPAGIVTATNVFAHIENIHSIVEEILRLLAPDGVFISESHYLHSLLDTLQYDTIYHEHLRYYSLESLTFLLEQHGLEIFHAKGIPTHGGSIRVYAARKGVYPVQPSVKEVRDRERRVKLREKLSDFTRRVLLSKLELMALLRDIKKSGKRICGVGAPSRASTLIHYVGLDDGLIDYVVEVKDSFKTGKYMPGTLIPCIEEAKLFADQPDYALMLSWHIADELMPKITAKGFRGRYIVPLPEPRVVSAPTV